MAHYYLDVNTTAFTPRDFQVELLAAIKEKNVILCLGNSYSKEFIALKAIQEQAHELRKHEPIKNVKQSIKKNTLYITNNGFQSTSSADVGNCGGESIYNSIHYLTDLSVININDKKENAIEWDTLFHTYNVIILSVELCVYALQYGHINFCNINLMIIENCHIKRCITDELANVLRAYEKCSTMKPRLLGLAGPLHSAECSPSRLTAEVEQLEKIVKCKVETASDIVTLLRYSLKPIEIILQCEPANETELTQLLHEQILILKNFIGDHRFDPSETYGSFKEEINKMSDPKLEPLKLIDEYLLALNDLGAWGADRLAFTLIKRIEKLKIKTAYERHFLLLCLTETTLVQIRAICERKFEKLANDKERIQKYSSPKVLRIIEILRLFKVKPVEDSTELNQDVVDHENGTLTNEMNETIPSETVNSLNVEKKKSSKSLQKVNELLAMKKNSSPTSGSPTSVSPTAALHLQFALKPFNRRHGTRFNRITGRTFSMNRYRNINTIDPDALYGIIFCNKDTIAKLLHNLIHTMSKCDKDLSYVCTQFTVGRTANPLTEPKEAETEHRKQEEVLKRFRMHDCNLLIGTSILEQGIDLPKCNLVIRWDPPTTYRSYVQCKGRARATNAFHIIMVTPIINDYQPPSLLKVNHTNDNNDNDDDNDADNPPNVHLSAQSHKLICSESYNLLVNDECSPVHKRRSPSDNLDKIIGDDDDVNDEDDIIIINNNNNNNKKLTQEKTLKHDPMVSNLMEKYVCVEKNTNDDEKSPSNNKNRKNTQYLINLKNMENCTRQMVEKTAHYKEIEKMLIKKCDNAEPLQKEFILSDKYTGCLEPYKPLSSNPTGPSVNLSTAIALINKYCAKLPSDTFTKLIPLWRCAKTIRLNKKWYQYTIRLPINSPLKQDILGLPMPTRILARRCAALIACRILHQSGELDDSLQPITKEGFRASEPDWEHFELDPNDEQMVSDNLEARPGTTKRRQYYYKKIAAVLSNCRPTANRFAYFYLIKLKLECPIPEEQNTRGRKVYPPEDDVQGFGILTLKEIPKLSAFPIFTRSGEVRVSIELSKQRVYLSETDLQHINTFLNYTFSKVLRLKKYFMVFDKDATENSFYIVPTIKRPTKNKEIKEIIEIDWEFLAGIAKSADDLPMAVSEEERSKTQFDMNKFTDAVVMPWYRNQDQPQYFYVAEICDYLSPESTFPGENYSTFKEYYYLKYNIKIQNANQPLLDVDHTSARLNFLTPRYVNRKGVALPTSSEETKRAKRENLEQKQILVPELCTIHPFPASLWRAAVCLPCILYRINALLLADEIRIQVANEIGLGKVEINDGDFKWPILDFGWSLAEVLKKSRDTRLIRQQQQQQQQQQKQQEQPKSEQPPSIKNKNNIEMVNGMKKANNNKDKQQPPITEQLNGNCDDGVLLIKTANDILEEADKKLKKNSVLEIGMWSNDMLNDINDCDDCEWGLLPPNIKMCSTDKNNIRYGSPTSWDVIDNRNNVSKNYSSNHTVGIDKNTNYYSDSDRSYGSDDSDDDDDDDFDTKSCDSNESNSNKLKIQFKSDNIAEAIETEEDILKQKRQIEIINNINAIKSNGGESEKNYVCGFMGFIDNCAVDVDIDDGKRIKQHELNFKKSIVNFQNYIYNSGMLIKYNQTLNIKDGKRIMAIASNPFHDLIKFDENVENDHPKNADDLDSNCDSVKGDVEDDEVMVDGTPSDDYDDDDRDGDGDDDEDDHYDCDHSEHFKYMDNISNLDKFYDLVSFVDHKIFNEYIKSKTIFTIDDLYALNRLYFEKQQQQEKHQKNGTYETYEIEGTGDLFDNFNDYHNIKIDTISNRKVLTIDIGEFFKERIINKIKDDILLLNDNSLRSNSQPVVVTNAEGQSPFINGFSFDYQPNLIGHYGPCPSVILQGLTMSNANDGINLERLETIGDSFLKYAITTYLYCKYDNVHEGKLSHLRSKQVSNLNLYRLGRRKMLGESMIATKFEPHDNWLPPCYYVPKDLEKRLHESKIPACDWNLSGLSNIKELTTDEIYDLIKHNYTIRKQLEQDVNQENSQEKTTDSDDSSIVNGGGGGDGYACFLPYNLVTQHSIPDKSIADCVEALIGSYLIECGPRGALLFMAWLGIRVLPYVEIPVDENYDKNNARFVGSTMPKQLKIENNPTKLTIEDNQFIINVKDSDSDSDSKTTKATKIIYGYWPKPASPLLLYAPNPYEKLELLLDGYDVFENKIGYKFTDRSYLLQAMTHASYIPNRLTDCYQRLEFLGDAVLDYLITRHLYEDARQHNPGSLTDLRSALVNNTIFASLAVRHGFHKYFRHLSPALNEVIDRFVRIQDENGHTISEEFYLRSEEECDEAEDIEVPKSLGDVFESIAGAIYLDSNKSLDTVWKVYYYLMKPEIELFSNSVPKSPIRELLELEPETAKFGKPEKLADGRRVRVSVEVFGKGTFRGIGRNYRIAKCTAAKCALRQLKKLGLISKKH